jgi:copper chaperone NosL
MTAARVLLLTLLLGACACARGLPEPVDPASSDSCAFCRMTVSDPRLAAQIVAVGEEPRFFDDIGCLVNWLKDNRPPQEAIAFVGDHRTGRWALAAAAVYTRVAGLQTPMGSGLIAHADAASRDQDPAARGGTPQTLEQVFGGRPPIFADAH